MSRANVDRSYFTFVKGLITEASPLTFPENASVDEDNFVLNIDGSRNRRLGMDYESSYSTYSQTVASTDAVGVFKWESVNGNADHNSIVVQTGSVLHIYDDIDGDAISANKIASTIDLTTYKLATATSAVVAQTPVSMTFGKGVLFVVSTYTEPFYVTYNNSTDSYVVTTYTIYERDLDGLDDGLAVDERPATLSSAHSYNLRNQGWTSTQITNYFAADSVYPSNAQQWQFGKYVSPSTGLDAWSAPQLDAIATGSAYVPKGHYIRSVFNTTDPSVSPTLDTPITGINYVSSTIVEIVVGVAHGLSTSDSVTINGNVWDWWNSLDGTYVVTVVDTYTFRIPYNNYSPVASIQSYGTVTAGTGTDIGTIYNRRPNVVSFFAGRVWYTGITVTDKLSTRIYYSQIINSEAEFGACYQRNDPTSEMLSDLLPNDGGFISIPDAGTIVGMAVTSSNLIVFATNGVWSIGGGSTGFFTATDYGVQKITNVGCASPRSIVVAEGTPMFAGYQGIYAIRKEQISGALSAVSLTTATVHTLYNSIPSDTKPYIVAGYDDVDKRVHFMFSDTTADTYKYNRSLIFDVRLEAFYTNTIPKTSPYIAGLIPRYGQSVSIPKVAYLTVIGGTSITFSTFNNTSFLDWYTYDSTGADAAAYLVAGYDLLGDAMRHRQAPYIFCYFTRTETAMTGASDLVFDNPSSCLMEVRWDWSDNSVSGKITTSQQVYRLRRMYTLSAAGPYDDGQPVVVTRNKVRGRGRAMNVKFSTEAGKDCKLLGWAVEYDAEKQQ